MVIWERTKCFVRATERRQFKTAISLFIQNKKQLHSYIYLVSNIPIGIFVFINMRDPEQTRQLIIDKALPIFNTKGYNAASLSDITTATGITKGAIYGNFKNKDEVASASFDHAVDIVMGLLRKEIKSKNNAPDKLRAIIDYYSKYVNNPPIPGGCPILNSSIEADDNLPFLKSKVIRTIALMKDSITKMITRGILEGQIKRTVDAEEFAVFIYASIEGAISLSRIEGDGRSYKHVRNRLHKMIDDMTS
jgi:AcrR family transcriptional regulator